MVLTERGDMGIPSFGNLSIKIIVRSGAMKKGQSRGCVPKNNRLQCFLQRVRDPAPGGERGMKQRQSVG